VTNKTATATASLVAAVPAALLGYFLVKSFLTGLGQLTNSTMFLGLYGVTLAACAAVVFLPFAVLIFGPKSPARQPASDESEKEDEKETGAEKGESSAAESFDAESFESGSFEEGTPELDAEVVEEAADVPTSSGEFEIVEPAASDAALGTLEDFDSGEAATQAFSTDDDFTFDDEDEPPAPKKKKK
jgi:hypothetical protein